VFNSLWLEYAVVPVLQKIQQDYLMLLIQNLCFLTESLLLVIIILWWDSTHEYDMT